MTYESNENLQGAYHSTEERHTQSFCRHPNKSAKYGLEPDKQE